MISSRIHTQTVNSYNEKVITRVRVAACLQHTRFSVVFVSFYHLYFTLTQSVCMFQFGIVEHSHNITNNLHKNHVVKNSYRNTPLKPSSPRITVDVIKRQHYFYLWWLSGGQEGTLHGRTFLRVIRPPDAEDGHQMYFGGWVV